MDKNKFSKIILDGSIKNRGFIFGESGSGMGICAKSEVAELLANSENILIVEPSCNSENQNSMKSTGIKGIFYDYNKSNIVKLDNTMYNDFCKCCQQEHYSHELISQTTDYVVCSADYRIIEFFISCMKSEHEETIKMLCSLSKATLVDRLNGIPFEEAEKWIDEVDMELINEAIQRYDEPEFIKERTEMMKLL